jgi:two-component system LytT family response regulator
MKALIIEDEERAATMLGQMLHQIDPLIEVADKCSDLPVGVKAIRRLKPQLVFLDIELPVYSGLQLLEFFEPEEIDFRIIFTTAYNQYAIKAFEMSAIDYLLKPIQEEKLRAALEKFYKQQSIPAGATFSALKQNLKSEECRKLVIPVSNGYELIDLTDLLYLKAEGSYTQIFIDRRPPVMVSRNLKYFEELLQSTGGFIRIHRSYLANIRRAKKILRSEGGQLVLDDSSQLPIVPEKIEEVIRMLS